MMGLAMGRGGSVLDVPAVLAILTSSLLVARLLGPLRLPVEITHLLQMLAGVLVIFLALSTQLATEDGRLGLGWIGMLTSENRPEGYALNVALGVIMGATLWWRGGRLASAAYPTESLASSFRIGLVVLGVAAVVDMVQPANLRIFPVMFLFFAAGLAGLSIGHILPAAQTPWKDGAWVKIVGAVVLIVVVTGLLFSLLQKSVLSLLSGPALTVLSALGTAIFYIVVIPIGFLVEYLIRILVFFIGLLPNSGESPEGVGATAGVNEMLRGLREASDGGPSLFGLLLEWTALGVLILVVLFVLAKAFRRGGRWLAVKQVGERESLTEGVDPFFDMARLLYGLVPDRFKREKGQDELKLPEDESGVVDVFRIYFGLLKLAKERGFPRSPNETPREYQQTLEKVFPQELVSLATSAFIRACYGHQPAPRDQIDAMRTSLERLA